jgi:5,5'-dehydrodivanillate O-demethylase
MHSKNDEGPDNLPWFRRFRSDGRMEPHVTRGDEGEFLIIDDDGWAASFKNGEWHDGIVFAHEQIAEFTPVQDRNEIYRLFGQARTALGAKGMAQDAKPRALSSQRDDFVRSGPGTAAGSYLRTFWNPVYHAIDLEVGRPVPLRVMGETFTLYRGESGQAFLVEAQCPHRGAQLSAARVETDALRCFYHGWKFESDGRCSEQPAEESRFCDKVSIRTWPVREYLGLIFAYLGQGRPPEFPLYPEFETFNGLLEIDSYLRRCNYFQNVENALDMSHVAFTHGDNRAAFDKIGLGRSLRAEESDWGITYTFTRDDGAKRVHQFGMPNMIHLAALPNDPEIGWQESLFWWVPVDDSSHLQFSIHRIPVAGEVAARVKERRQARRSRIDIAHQDACDMVLSGRARMEDFDGSRVDLVRLQDDVAQLGQGIIADRSREHLGRADVGITAIRRLWRRELANLASGLPCKHWSRSGAIKVHAWNIPGNLARVSGEDPSDRIATKAEIVDVRPFVEIEKQKAALHCSPRDYSASC